MDLFGSCILLKKLSIRREAKVRGSEGEKRDTSTFADCRIVFCRYIAFASERETSWACKRKSENRMIEPQADQRRNSTAPNLYGAGHRSAGLALPKISNLKATARTSISLEYCTVPIFLGPQIALRLEGHMLAITVASFAAHAPTVH